jgi:CheY-like chemotaxis protein
LHVTFLSKLQLKPESRIRLVCDKALSIGQLEFRTDELKLKQIFVNLLDNAIKFTGQGTIRFGFLMPENGTITCFVSDTGIGIDPKYSEIIFERFRQAEIPDRNKYKGTGLGLAICKGNAELLGGRIWVESELGNGSTFFFRIPFIQILDDGSENISQKLISGYNWKDKNIVIVEDDYQSVTYLQTILRKTGVTIFVAPNGTSFRQLLAERTDIHLILMDIQLPDEDGWQLTEYSKSVRSEIPVIVQTAFGMESDRLKSFAAGCDSFITKPISPEELFNAIALYLEK